MMQRAIERLIALDYCAIRRGSGFEKVAAAIGMAAVCTAIAGWQREDAASPAATVDSGIVALGEAGDRTTATVAGSARDGTPSGTGRDIMAGGYLGMTHTHRSTVHIKNGDRTDMTVRDFEWEGKPFKSPIYYGLRAISWPAGSRWGAMVDFTHGKAIARFEDVGTFTGVHEGKPLPPKAKVGDVFKHLEFSHGHNMLTLNGMTRLGSFAVQPYVGAGGGISLPHTEIAFRTENGRTYEYQYAGLVGQALAGLEVNLGRISVFIEYKLSYAPYDVPLSGVVNGWLLFTDIWRQMRAWMVGEKPPGGRLATNLVTHHAIGGALAHVAAPARGAGAR